MRWLIIIFLFYLIVKVLRGFLAPKPGEVGRRPKADERDRLELVQDSYCGVYFPRSEGVAHLVDGQVLYFHTAECRDKYIETHRGKPKGGSE
jgi:hypothetical protein